MDKLPLTASEAGKVLGEVYELMRAGAIESVRLGGSRRIPASVLDQYVRRLRTASSGYEIA